MSLDMVAAGAIAVLTPYFKQGGEAFAKKAGEKLAEKAGSLYQAVKAKFAGDKDAEDTLDRAESKPESKARLLTLEESLVEKLSADSDFADVVRRLLEDAKDADSEGVLVIGNRNIGIGGNANSGVFVTGDDNQINKS